MNEFSKITVNYMAIVDTLLASTNAAHAKHSAVMCFGDDGKEIREFRTVGFTIGRQQGKTEFIRDFCKRHPGEVAVIIQDVLANSTAFSTRFKEKEGNPLVSYSRAYHRILVTTQDALGPKDKLKVDEFNKRYILVDDASFFIDWLHQRRIKQTDLYKAIGRSRGTDVNVILVG